MQPTDGAIVISTELDNAQLEKDYQKLVKHIEALEDKLAKEQAGQSPLIQQAEELQIKIQEARLEAEKYKQAWMGGVVGADSQEIKAREQVAALKAEYDAVLGKVEAYDNKIAEINGQLDTQKEKAGGIAAEMVEASKSTSRMAEATDKAGDFMEKFTKKLKDMMKRAFVLAVIAKALSGMRDWMGKAIKTNDEATKAMARLKGALLTMVQPLISVVIPAFTALVNILSRTLEALAHITSFIFGTTAAESAKAAEALHNQANATEEAGAAAKEAGKQLAGFDEINQNASSSADSGLGADTDATAPDFSAFDPDAYKDKISELEIYMSGALLALGAILVFSGANIPLGLGLLVIGAIGLAKVLAQDWESMSNEVKKAATAVLIVLGGAAFVVGAILAFSGADVPLGIALMGLGAVALGTALGLNWDSMSAGVQNAITAVMLVLGVAALVIGAILVFSGANLPLGIGLIIGGAILLGTAAALNWNSLPVGIQNAISVIMLILGSALLVIGAILAFSGANMPLGIALIIGGIAVTATAVALNWGKLGGSVGNAVAAIATVVGLALLVIGAILAFSGTAIPLGIGLMIGGAAMLGTAAILNWSAVENALKGPIGDIALLVGGALLVLGALAAFSGIAVPLGIALLVAGAAILATTVAVNWNSTKDKVTYVLTALGKVVAGAAMAIGVVCLISGMIPIGLALIGGSALAFFGLSAIGSKGNNDELVEGVSDGLNKVEKEIDSRQKSTRSRSKSLATNMTGGLSEGITESTPDVQESFADALESSVEAGNEAMEISSDYSEVTEAQGNEIVEGWLLALAAGQITVGDATTKVMEAVKNAVIGSRVGIVNSFRQTYNSILDSTQSFISRYLSGMRQMMEATAELMSALPDAPQLVVPAMPHISLPPIPMLARGAVIPPNREFLAVLGDQKHGTNIEAPADLIAQIVRDNSGGGNAAILQTLQAMLDAIRAGQVIQMDGQTVARTQRPYNQQADRIAGGRISNRRLATNG